MNRYKGIIGEIINNQKTLVKESLDGTVLKEQYTDFDAYVERVSEAYWKIEKRLKYLCPIKTFETEKGATVIYTGYCSSLGNDVYTQVVCFCEWADESLPEVVTITNSYGNPETILKRTFKQEPTSLQAFGGNDLKSNEKAKQYKVSALDLEKEGCKVNRKGGMAVERYWLSFVQNLDKKNEENRKQEWVKKQEENYTPEVTGINQAYFPHIWTIKTGFKFVKKTEQTTKYYSTVWEDADGNLFGKEGEELWAPGCIQLWADSPEKLDMNNVKKGVEKAVNNVIKNRSWSDFTLGRYDNYRGGESKSMPKLPVKLIKWS